MYHFEGDFKKKPVQSFGGTTKKEQTSALLARTLEERKRREQHRKEVNSASKIQSFYRGAKCRQKKREEERSQFDKFFSSFSKRLQQEATVEINALVALTRQLLFFYRRSDVADQQRLISLCQIWLKHQNTLFLTDKQILYQLCSILKLCCWYLESTALSSSKSSVAVPLRMLSIFTLPKTYEANGNTNVLSDIFSFLVKNGYFRCLRLVVDEKIPSSLERSIAPPTPIAETLLELLLAPLSFIPLLLESQKKLLLTSMCDQLLAAPFSPQVHLYLLPALVDKSSPELYSELLVSLCPTFPDDFIDLVDMETESSEDGGVEKLPVVESLWLLSGILQLAEKHLSALNESDIRRHLHLLTRLVPCLGRNRKISSSGGDEDEDSDEDGEMSSLPEPMEIEGSSSASGSSSRFTSSDIYAQCMELLNSPAHVDVLINVASSHGYSSSDVEALCLVCYTLMTRCRAHVLDTRLLYKLAFNLPFLRVLWNVCLSVSLTSSFTGSKTPLIQLLSRGVQLKQVDLSRIVSLLHVFCAFFGNLVLTLHDNEFFGSNDSDVDLKPAMPFRVEDLVPMSLALRDVTLGLIELAHPDTMSPNLAAYQVALSSIRNDKNSPGVEELRKQRYTWSSLFKVVSSLLKQLYTRNSRRQFCPPNHWIPKHLTFAESKLAQLCRTSGADFMKRPFGSMSILNPNRMSEDEGPPKLTSEVRMLTILKEAPFIIPFEERVKIFRNLVHADKLERQGEVYGHQHPVIDIMVRRSHLYEDAFERLSRENEPNLKLRMQVRLKNFAGLDEAGIDGGGIQREFMNELIKTAFDPNRGFFKYTSDKLLYPNPQARLLVPDYIEHYYFLGRIVGKAMYEKMLVELPFAGFFLSKISRHRGNVDIHHLSSLDPEMYKNLLFLKHHQGDVSEFGLDFTVVTNELGEAQVEELKPGGRDVPVTNNNTIEYIHLVADYRLNKQIRDHTNSFVRGLSDVIDINWLSMFDHNELQTLISGAQIPIDIDDLKRNTNYSGVYNKDHPMIRSFWRVVENFSSTQKRQLLKFVTSCSRPPLLGFKELYPPFCIHYGGSEDRLPTASTCMNLLKLPEFRNEETLRQKLIYAIEAGAGFELS